MKSKKAGQSPAYLYSLIMIFSDILELSHTAYVSSEHMASGSQMLEWGYPEKDTITEYSLFKVLDNC